MKTILDLKPCLVKFDLEKNIKDKIYLDDCHIKSMNCEILVVIIYNNQTFFANNRKASQ